VDEAVHTLSGLRDIVGAPQPTALEKGRNVLDQYAEHFLSLCPFICIGSSDRNGVATVSPRGDPPGFIVVLDERTIVLPDRPGNRRTDTMRNILENPRIGIVALVPGIGETLRISGRGSLTTAAELLARCEVAGRVPRLGIKVEIEDVFFHCAKAIIRSDLWGGRYTVSDGQFPSYAEVLRGQRRRGQLDDIQTEIDESYNNRLY
jgi:PPOX class probable FMN-dependent enzyme